MHSSRPTMWTHVGGP